MDFSTALATLSDLTCNGSELPELIKITLVNREARVGQRYSAEGVRNWLSDRKKELESSGQFECILDYEKIRLEVRYKANNHLVFIIEPKK